MQRHPASTSVIGLKSGGDIDHFIPTAPNWQLNWKAVSDAFPWIAAMKGAEQNPRHHAEGDVWTHVGMVTEALVASPDWREAPPAARRILFAAALLHDVAKPRTKRLDPTGTEISHPNHSAAGAIDARTILWRMGWTFDDREAVCTLIRHHQVPFYLIEHHPMAARRRAIEISLGALPTPDAGYTAAGQGGFAELLAQLAKADAMGRICHDQNRILDNVELFAETCRIHKVIDQPFRFPSSHTRYSYFAADRMNIPDPGYEMFDDRKVDVILMSGLPGSGKSTWIQANAADLPVVSLDELRRRMKVDPEDDQGSVIQATKEAAKVHLRARQPFIWDGTNVSRLLREQPLTLLGDYKARVKIVYCETSEKGLRAGNRARDHVVPDAVIDRLLNKWEVPTSTECHTLDQHIR